MMTLPWLKAEEDFLRKNAGSMQMSELVRRLKRSETAIRLKMHRMRITLRSVVPDKENPLFSIINAKYNGHPEYFTPSQGFYDRTGIKKVLFWKMYRGEVRASVDVCKKVAEELGVTGVELIGALQQSLFDNPDFISEENPQTNNNR